MARTSRLRRIAARLACLLTLAGSALGASAVTPEVAHARRTTDLGYRYDQVWTAAVRLVRVDYGFSVTERDQELGFVMFEYLEDGRPYNGSIEVLRTADNLGRDRVRVVVVIQGQPEYVERMIVDRLERKLRGDYGAPPRVEPVQPAAPAASSRESAEAEPAPDQAEQAPDAP